MGALKRATKREREREREWEQSSKPKNLGQKKKTLTLNSQALCDKNKERSGLKAPKRGREVGALKRATKREREREWEQSSKPKNLGQKKKTLTLNSQALCDKNKERSGLKAPKRGREVGALKRATKREREREREKREKWEQSSKPKNLGQKKKTLTLNSQALCDKNKERSGLKAPKRGREVGALKRATKRERERERERERVGAKLQTQKLGAKEKNTHSQLSSAL